MIGRANPADLMAATSEIHNRFTFLQPGPTFSIVYAVPGVRLGDTLHLVWGLSSVIPFDWTPVSEITDNDEVTVTGVVLGIPDDWIIFEWSRPPGHNLTPRYN